MVTKSDAPMPSTKTRRRQFTLLILAIIGLAIAIYLGSILRETRPEYYQTARTALITARQRLDESYTHEAALLEQLHTTHQDLEAAVAALNKARVDHANQREVDTIRTHLHALEDVKRLERTSPEQLQQSYREIEAQLSALIKKLERVKP